jgi:hypothetical protein
MNSQQKAGQTLYGFRSFAILSSPGFKVVQSSVQSARGIKIRRHDVPNFISEFQTELLTLVDCEININIKPSYHGPTKNTWKYFLRCNSITMSNCSF